MKLRELLNGVPVASCAVDLEMEIAGVSYDSRATQPGDLFVAMTGYATDGHKYIATALEKGAAAVLCQNLPEGDGPYIRTADSRRALAVIGANWFGHPAEEMTMIAVTGTCGKTTTTYLLKAILEQAREAKVGLIGTNQNMIGQEVIPTDRTTPESFEVQRLFREMADAGCAYAVMETSSHALCLDRVYGVHYEVGIFTNLTQDHLDFHVTMENYCDAKAILFRNCGVGVVNGDDPWTPRLLRECACPVLRYGTGDSSRLRGENLRLTARSVAFDALLDGRRIPVTVPIPGRFTVYNALAALGICHMLGVPPEQGAAALQTASGIKGRMEVVPTPGLPCTVLIDYAHTPDALENVLKTMRHHTAGKLWVVFGCGGDRDKLKRPIMGRIARELADRAVVTDDNPRTEDAAEIRRQILCECPDAAEIGDRVEAINYAVSHLGEGDMLVIAGKGHENGQKIGDRIIPMNDLEEAAKAIARLSR